MGSMKKLDTKSFFPAKNPEQHSSEVADLKTGLVNTAQNTGGKNTLLSLSGAEHEIKNFRNISAANEEPAQKKYEVHVLDLVQPLDPRSFPHPPRNGNSTIQATIANVKHLLDSYHIEVGYNTVRKQLSITIPGQSGMPDNADNVAFSHIYSLAALNNMSVGQIASFIYCIGDRNPFNPIASWITSKPWDGIDRLTDFHNTLVEADDFPKLLKEKLLYRWMLSAVAAAMKSNGFRSRGVLTLQGPQSIGKTSWIAALVPDQALREYTVKLDHHIDAGNKDSLLTAIAHWIVEIGELDSSFKKDIARLKGFLTSDRDKVRRPYGRTDSEYPRRTVFCATVNDHNFLVDSTGNSRWWTIPVVKINYTHGIDMQQLFAQLLVDFNDGAQWWLTPEEEQLLEELNKSHRSISAVRERIISSLDLTAIQKPNLPAMTAIEVLIETGLKNPSNSQCKECASVLRECLGEPKKIKGFMKWRIPLNTSFSSALTPIPSVSIADDERF